MRGRMWFLCTAGAGLALDQISKAVAFAHHRFHLGAEVTQVPLQLWGGELAEVQLSLVRAYNAGLLFGWGEDLDYLHPFLVVFRSLALLWICWLARRRLRHLALQICGGLLAGGIAGNLADNLQDTGGPTYGAVRDFLLLRLDDRQLPAANLADLCITLGGLGLLLLFALRVGSGAGAAPSPSEAPLPDPPAPPAAASRPPGPPAADPDRG